MGNYLYINLDGNVVSGLDVLKDGMILIPCQGYFGEKDADVTITAACQKLIRSPALLCVKKRNQSAEILYFKTCFSLYYYSFDEDELS